MKHFAWPAAMILAATCCVAQAADREAGVSAELPPRLRSLLIQEMVAMSEAMDRIRDALVRGQDEVVAENAQDIFDSFILKKEMTESDRDALHAAVPGDFLERDHAFHELSSELATAARAGDRSRQLTIFTDMIDACRQCHAEHAADRFPELNPD